MYVHATTLMQTDTSLTKPEKQTEETREETRNWLENPKQG